MSDPKKSCLTNLCLLRILERNILLSSNTCKFLICSSRIRFQIDIWEGADEEVED